MAKTKLKAKEVNPKKIKQDLHLKPEAELKSEATKLRLELAHHVLSMRTGREKNTRLGFNKRKLLAKTLTTIREKELELKA